MIAFLSEAEGEHGAEHVNELLFEPIWFGVMAMGAFIVLLGVLWAFRNTLALDPHTGDTGADGDAHGQPSASSGSGPTQGQASQH